VTRTWVIIFLYFSIFIPDSLYQTEMNQLTIFLFVVVHSPLDTLCKHNKSYTSGYSTVDCGSSPPSGHPLFHFLRSRPYDENCQHNRVKLGDPSRHSWCWFMPSVGLSDSSLRVYSRIYCRSMLCILSTDLIYWYESKLHPPEGGSQQFHCLYDTCPIYAVGSDETPHVWLCIIYQQAISVQTTTSFRR
jgi:hypothetical protein